jgi:hypothetical protein
VFFLGFHTDVAQDLFGHFGKENLNDVEPRTMFRCEYQFKPPRNRLQIGLGFLGNMRRMIIQNDLDLQTLFVMTIELLEKLDELLAPMSFFYRTDHFTGDQINTR